MRCKKHEAQEAKNDIEIKFISLQYNALPVIHGILLRERCLRISPYPPFSESGQLQLPSPL
jgi:hypothetical protein